MKAFGALALFLLSASTASAYPRQAKGSKGRKPSMNGLTGQWEAVDVEDGSQLTMSLTPGTDGDYVAEIRDTNWLSCLDDGDIPESNPFLQGLAVGNGVLDGHTLTVKATLYCTDDAGTIPFDEFDWVFTQKNGYWEDGFGGDIHLGKPKGFDGGLKWFKIAP